MTPKPPIPWYWWPVWMLLLAAGLFVFYVLLTPVWVGIRLIEWFAPPPRGGGEGRPREKEEAARGATTASLSGRDVGCGAPRLPSPPSDHGRRPRRALFPCRGILGPCGAGIPRMGEFAARAMGTQYVYDFSEGGRARPRAARRQGRRPRGDDRDRAAGAGRLHRDDGGLPRVHAARGERCRTGSTPRSRAPSRGSRSATGKRFGDPGRPAARLGALGRRGLDARDDGHDPQPRPERRGGRRPRPRDRERALRLRRLPAARADVRGRGRRRGRPALRAGAVVAQGRARRHAGRRARRRRPARARGALQAALPGRSRRTPASSSSAPSGGLRLVGHAAGAGLPPRERHPGRPRHGRERRPDGLRQQGRRLGHRRRLHARPLDGRAGPLGRVPRQRAGRGRRRRHPHARADRGHARALPRGVRAARGDDGPPRGALPRDAGHRVHGRGGHALPPADPHRQAHGRGGAPDRRRHGLGGAAHAGGGGRARRPGAARPAPPPDDRPGRRLRGRREGPERLARAPRPGRSSSTPTGPRSRAARGRRSSSSAPRRRPTTSTGSSRRAAS